MTMLHRLAPLALFVLASQSAHAIEDGFEASPCAWPEVIRVFSGFGPIGDFDGPESQVCTGVYIGGRTILTTTECVSAAPQAHAAHWGEQFGVTPNATGSVHFSIPLDDCRAHPVLPIAACSLREAPTMQAIPLLAPCEVDELLVEGADLFVVGANQRKRWASASSAFTIPAGAIEFEMPDTIWATQTELSSQVLESMDRGGPLYVRAPDGSLRIAAITSSTDPARWIGAWNLVDWLIEFEQPEVVLPCHSPAGAWAPTAGCTSLVADRSTGEGSWGRGPAVCTTTQTVTPTPTCP